jgi:hypothetical protein
MTTIRTTEKGRGKTQRAKSIKIKYLPVIYKCNLQVSCFIWQQFPNCQMLQFISWNVPVSNFVKLSPEKFFITRKRKDFDILNMIWFNYFDSLNVL